MYLRKLKALYQDIRAGCYYFQKHLKSTAQRDVSCVQAQAVLAMSISVALSPDHGRSATSADQARVSGDITK